MSIFLQKVMKPLEGIKRRSRKRSADYTVTPVPERKTLIEQDSTNELTVCINNKESSLSPGEIRRRKILSLRWSSTSIDDDDDENTPLTCKKERLEKIQNSITWLRQELIDMRAMDQQLVTQLMDIRRTIHQLKLEDCETGQEQMDEFDSTIAYEKIPRINLDTIHELGDNKERNKLVNGRRYSDRFSRTDNDIDEIFEIEKADLTFDIKQMLDVCL